MQSTDEKYMKEAIKQAKKAYAIGEVPIGCVIVYQDKIIYIGYKTLIVTGKAIFRSFINNLVNHLFRKMRTLQRVTRNQSARIQEWPVFLWK